MRRTCQDDIKNAAKEFQKGAEKQRKRKEKKRKKDKRKGRVKGTANVRQMVHRRCCLREEIGEGERSACVMEGKEGRWSPVVMWRSLSFIEVYIQRTCWDPFSALQRPTPHPSALPSSIFHSLLLSSAMFYSLPLASTRFNSLPSSSKSLVPAPANWGVRARQRRRFLSSESSFHIPGSQVAVRQRRLGGRWNTRGPIQITGLPSYPGSFFLFPSHSFSLPSPFFSVTLLPRFQSHPLFLFLFLLSLFAFLLHFLFLFFFLPSFISFSFYFSLPLFLSFTIEKL